MRFIDGSQHHRVINRRNQKSVENLVIARWNLVFVQRELAIKKGFDRT